MKCGLLNFVKKNWQNVVYLWNISLELINVKGCRMFENPFLELKYNHIIRLNGREFNLKIGDRIKQSNSYWAMSMNGVKRDGFFAGTFIKPNASKQMIRFPLYKTVEEYRFYRN